MPPTNCTQANQSAGNGRLAISGGQSVEARSWRLASHTRLSQQEKQSQKQKQHPEQPDWSTRALTRVSAPHNKKKEQEEEQREQIERASSRLAVAASAGRIGAPRLAPTGSTPNELTMCRGRQVYDYICIDCEWPKSVLSLSLSCSSLSLLLVLLQLFLSLPLSFGCCCCRRYHCLLCQSGLLLVLCVWWLRPLYVWLEAGQQLNRGQPVGPTPQGAHLEAPPIISVLAKQRRQSCATGKGLFEARAGAGNRIIPASSTLDTMRIHNNNNNNNNQPDTNVKCKRHWGANLRGALLHLAHYGGHGTRCCHYSSSSRPSLLVGRRLGVSGAPSQPRPSGASSSPGAGHSRAGRSTTRGLLCVLLLLNVGGGGGGSRQELAKGQPSIMRASASASSPVAQRRFTTTTSPPEPEIADKKSQPLSGSPKEPVFSGAANFQAAAQRVGHRNERAPTSGGQLLARHKHRHSSHAAELAAPARRAGGASLIGAGSPSSGLNGNLLLVPWGQSASGAQHLESGACAPGCVCLWKNGKQAADCSQDSHQHQPHPLHRQPAALPVGLDPLTQVLNLTGQPLGELAAGAFASLQLTNLQRIHLAKCQLSLIHARAFERLKLLVELELSWNQLKVVPVPGGTPSATATTTTSSPTQMHLLRRLVMRGNPLGALEERTLLPANELSAGSSSAPRHRAPLERLLETYPELGPLLASSSELALTKLASEAPLGRAGANSQVAADTLWAQLEAALEAADRGAASSELAGRKGLLAAHFPQIQELDFGQCQLVYIKWNVFAHLNQLKRLLLDGNQLSQLSGQLVRLLPVNLHQLALEGNPLVCDCRAQALARWLASSRIPLSSPVRCQQPLSHRRNPAMHPTAPQRLVERTAKSLGTSLGDELPDDELVCAPQEIDPAKPAPAPEPTDQLSPPPLHLLIHYLWPTLIRNSEEEELNEKLAVGEASSVGLRQSTALLSSSGGQQQPQLMQVREGDKLALKCPLLAYPEWSVQFVWLVEYGGAGRAAGSPAQPLGAGQLPAEERLLVLYDSRLLSRSARFNGGGPLSQQGNLSRHQQQQLLVSEQATHGARFLVREARLQLESAFVESQMIIESAVGADSGRYKCMGLNKAGNASLEFIVRVRGQSGAVAADLAPDSSPHDAGLQFDHQQPTLAKSTLMGAAISQSSGGGGGGGPKPASKGSATVQVTMVLVSALMGAVIVAFVLFCVLIYQIKPSSASGSLDGRRLEESLPEVGSRQQSPAVAGPNNQLVAAHQLLATAVHCDPRTGQSVAVHQHAAASSPASSLGPPPPLTVGPPSSIHSLASSLQQPLVAVRRAPEVSGYHQAAIVQNQNPVSHHLLVGPRQPNLVNGWQPVALL